MPHDVFDWISELSRTFGLWILAGIATFLLCRLSWGPCLEWWEDRGLDLEKNVQQITGTKGTVDFYLNRLAAPELTPLPNVNRPTPCDNGHIIQKFGVVEARGSVQSTKIVASRSHDATAESIGTSDLLKTTMAASRHSAHIPEGLVSPACRLPPEILMEVLEIAVKSNGHCPLSMMHVCHYWRIIAFGLARIWSGLTIHPWTSRKYVEFLIERSRRIPLEVEINLNDGLGDGRRRGEGVDLAMRTTSRWRTLTLAGFPARLDIDTVSEEGNSATTLAMPQLQALKVTNGGEMTTSFTQLLRAVATTSTHRLVHMEITSLDAFLFLANPEYRDLFRRLKHFKVDARGMTDPVDILPYFENLEVLEAYGLRLPIYDDNVDLPLVRTLKRMILKFVRAQWMSGRTFPALEESQIIRTHCAQACWSGNVHLPICTVLTYAERSMKGISEFRLPQLDKMIIRNEAWDKRGGSAQLSSVWGQSAKSIWLRPRVLHLDIYCYDQDLVNALRLHTNLEELVLGLVRPYALGKKFFSAMAAKRLKGGLSAAVPASGLAQPTEASENLLVATLLPNLKIFGVRYRRWIRGTERDDVIPLLNMVIDSREKTEAPLQSVKFWPTKDTPEEDALELVLPHG